MSIELLCKAAFEGNLEEVVRLIEDPIYSTDPNTLHPNGSRAIDFAAHGGHLNIIQYLLSKGAILAVTEGIHKNDLVFWITQCGDKEKRNQMLEWLLGEDHDSELEIFFEQFSNDNDLSLKSSNDFFWEGSLDHHPDKSQNKLAQSPGKINFNATLCDRNDRNNEDLGITVGYTLILQEHFNFFEKYLLRHPEIYIDLDAAPSHDHHPNKGVTLARLLMSEHLDFLKTYLNNHPFVVINLNAASSHDNNVRKGCNLALSLVLIKQVDFLKKYLNNHPFLIINLNSTPLHANNPNKGLTLAHLLILDGEIEFLRTYLNNRASVTIDLNSTPANVGHPNRGVTVALSLIFMGYMDFLQTYLNIHPESTIDFSAVPLDKDHPFKGITLAQYLASDEKYRDFLKNYLIKHPDTNIDLTMNIAGPSNRTVLEFLFETLDLPTFTEIFESRSDEEMERIIAHHANSPSHSHVLADLCRFTFVTKKHRELNGIMQIDFEKTKIVDPEAVELRLAYFADYKNIFRYSLSLARNHFDYKKMQSLTALIIFSYIHQKELHEPLLKMLEESVDLGLPRLGRPMSTKSKLYFFMEKCLVRGDDKDEVTLELRDQISAEKYQQIDKLTEQKLQLDKELKKAKKIIARMERKNAATSSQGGMFSGNSKKRKREAEKGNEKVLPESKKNSLGSLEENQNNVTDTEKTVIRQRATMQPLLIKF